MENKKRDILKTDMNDRERERFAKQLRDMSDAANKAAVALDDRNDTDFVVGVVIFSLMSGGMKEMLEVAKSAMKADRAAVDEFPEIISG